ncbi:toxin-antitoxin system, antitoxin component, PHD family protein [bacterium]|nr:toxin-antitoxin system, antitoxin component, PHD family protein [bacterium]
MPLDFQGHIAYIIVRQTKLVFKTRLLEVKEMLQVNILEAKTEFSKLIRLLESKREDSITVARNGKPVVRMTLINDPPFSKRIGAAKGKFSINGSFDADNAEIAELLSGGAL